MHTRPSESALTLRCSLAKMNVLQKQICLLQKVAPHQRNTLLVVALSLHTDREFESIIEAQSVGGCPALERARRFKSRLSFKEIRFFGNKSGPGQFAGAQRTPRIPSRGSSKTNTVISNHSQVFFLPKQTQKQIFTEL